jgi:[ribosomal protein S18]-alanine N-acetyltransferase
MERRTVTGLAPPIQSVGPAYAAVLAAIHAASFQEEPWGAAAFQTQLEMHGVIGLLDKRGGLLMLRVTADESEILTICVLPRLRRSGIARGLLQAGIVKAAELGAASMFLEVDMGNRAAQALYAAAGFTEVGRRKRYYANGADALVLRLQMPPVSSG